jgi:CRISPR/Cas system-associated protein Csm6
MPSTARTDEKKSEEDKESVLFSTDTENGGRTGLKLT